MKTPFSMHHFSIVFRGEIYGVEDIALGGKSMFCVTSGINRAISKMFQNETAKNDQNY